MPENKEVRLKNWNFVFSGIKDQEGIDEEEKKEITKNWWQLRTTLGEDWFKDEKNVEHPLRGYLLNWAPWSIRWVSEFGFGISSLKSKENFDEILNRLLSVEKFHGAYYEFRVALSLLESNVSFEFLKRTKNRKTPDIKIISGIRPLFLEITKMNAPEKYALASQNYHTLSNYLFSKISERDLDFCCDIQKVLSTPRTNKIVGECEKLIERVKMSGFEHYHDEKMDIYIFKKGNRNLVPKEKQVIQGIMPYSDEISRIKGTIKDKVLQLENHPPSVLVVFDDLFWADDMDSFYKHLVEELVATVEEYQKLSALVVYIEMGRAFDDEIFIKTGTNSIAIKGYDEALQRSKDKVIILNEFADCTLLQDEIEILKTI